MTEESLREIVSKLLRINPGELNAETRLAGPLDGSLGRARLDANLRSSFGIVNRAIYTVATFGELCAVLGIASFSNPAAHDAPEAAAPAASPIETHATDSGITVGVDVELVGAMPEVLDYWEDDFYKITFTSREIAHALLQPSPRASFAAMWCAKEALHKAYASQATTDWRRIEVIHDEAGKPSLSVNGRKSAGALSLSHTDEIAIAIFVSAAAPLNSQQPVAPVSPSLQAPAATNHGHSGRVALLVAALALLLSGTALAFLFLHH